MNLTNLLLVVLVILVCALLFTSGRIYENCVMIRELDDKLDKLDAELSILREVHSNDKCTL